MRLPPTPILVRPSLLRLFLRPPRLLSPLHSHQRTLITSSTPTPTINVRTIPAPHSGSIRILSLNRPSARNAISVQLLSELSHQIKSIHAEGDSGPTRALIIASEIDTAFCAGADLKERLKMTQDEQLISPTRTSHFLTTLRSTFTSITALPIPTLSALSSLALGGGLELALTTSLRLFASSALVALPETRLAILPGAGGTYRLPALIGPSRALDLVLTGRRVGGAEAYFMGLCDRLVEVGDGEGMREGVARERVLEEAAGLAREICEGGPVAVREAVGAVRGWTGGEAVENRAYERVVGTEDRGEALRAFKEKRRPMFKGR